MKCKLTFKTARLADRLATGNKNEIIDFDGVVTEWQGLTATISTRLKPIELCKALTRAHIHPASIYIL